MTAWVDMTRDLFDTGAGTVQLALDVVPVVDRCGTGDLLELLPDFDAMTHAEFEAAPDDAAKRDYIVGVYRAESARLHTRLDGSLR